MTQVRAVTAALTAAAKATGSADPGRHVTKEGSDSRPRSLEHLVDVVLHFEGDRNGGYDVRASKNRFGARRRWLFPVARQRD
ncbi:DNA repair radA domain protein [Mycobacterium kansasii 662]|uniref:DNA repair radA domain protein n=1 Tax=Mycobacterium kansasii 662 TaxID=1299326 RepID=X7XT63_MYCKA|nr:DNA repair radA domain protein [Mycobacterium kansasii 662]